MEDYLNQKLLLFSSGEMNLAVSLRYVSGIHKVPRLHRLPLSPPYLLGISIVKGRLMGVIDLNSFLKGTMMENPNYLLELKVKEPIGVLIDRVIGIEEPSSLWNLDNKYIKADLTFGDSHFGVLDASHLFEDLKESVLSHYRGS